MGKNIVEKIFLQHLVSGTLEPGKPISLQVDQVYTQDATGTMTWLEFEAIGLDRVKVPLAVSYIDHNMLQSNFMNADDHQFLQTAAKKFGAYFSKPGNGICHQVHLERFAVPGKIALGTDSHTPTGGGIGMIAIGVGGLEAATVLAGAPFTVNMPKVVGIKLTGKLQRPYVTAMDVILTILKMLTVKGGVGKIMQYFGDGVSDLSVTERATITNMGAELGATTSIFPSDSRTLSFLKAQGREKDFIELLPDEDAQYDEIITINLDSIEPMIAKPHSPDNVVPVRELEGTKVNQVCIGSCTNSSYQSMLKVASILKGKTIAEHVNLLITPGSKQVFEMMMQNGALLDIVASGARVMEASCGACIGMGGAPGTEHVSVRSYNRNFHGRSGTKDAYVYLASPVACAIFAIKGHMTDPRNAGVEITEPDESNNFTINDNLLIPPSNDMVQIIKGPNIKDVPVKGALKNQIEAEVILKTADNITTDDIMPAGSKVLPFRSNIPAISQFVFENIDATFSHRALAAKQMGGGIIVGGFNYGQGSSREHAAIAPMYLGIQAVIAKSFARIHRSNLINFGILPLLFKNPDDYSRINQGDHIRLKDLIDSVQHRDIVIAENIDTGLVFELQHDLNSRERELIIKGGLLPAVRA